MLAPKVMHVRGLPCAAVPLKVTAMGDRSQLGVTHTHTAEDKWPRAGRGPAGRCSCPPSAWPPSVQASG